jgi:protein ImuA
MAVASRVQLADLRARIERLGGTGARKGDVLPFGVDEIDQRLPKGGLLLGAVHEIAGGAHGAVDGAAAIAFAAGIAARASGKVSGQVLWAYAQADLFSPALSGFGLPEDQVVFFEAADDDAILGCCEEALRHGGLSCVVGEVAKLSRVASQRLQMAAEATGTLSLIVRRWRRQVDARDFGAPTAAYTRWRVTELPSASLPVRGLGRPRWFLELMRCRGADCAEFEVEACDDKGFIHLPAVLADGQVASPTWRAVS